jgi:serine/threonine protein kinase
VNLGEGAFGSTITALNLRPQTFVAIKEIECEENGIPPQVIREISVLQQLKHPKIVHLEVLVMEHRQVFLIFEVLLKGIKKYLAGNYESKCGPVLL